METAIVVSSGDATLSEQERNDLFRCEEVIGRGLQSFVEVGLALVKIRVEGLYRQEYSDFNHYCRQRWSISRIHAHRCIEAAKVHEMLPIGNRPANEAQARPMTLIRTEDKELDRKAIVRVWNKVLETAPVDGAGRKVITAREVEIAVKPVLSRRGIRVKSGGYSRRSTSEVDFDKSDSQVRSPEGFTLETFIQLQGRVQELAKLMQTETLPESVRQVIDDVCDLVLGAPV